MSISLDQNRLQATVAVSRLQAQQPVVPVASSPQETENFQQILTRELEKSSLAFSKHAMRRVSERSIDVSKQVMDKVTSAVDKAEGRGIRDALIIGSNSAFIVNVPTRTIITTLNGEDMNDAVFTNIDGTVLL